MLFEFVLSEFGYDVYWIDRILFGSLVVRICQYQSRDHVVI